MNKPFEALRLVVQHDRRSEDTDIGCTIAAGREMLDAYDRLRKANIRAVKLIAVEYHDANGNPKKDIPEIISAIGDALLEIDDE